MKNGGMHKHTWFYLVEIGLAAVLVLVTVLFFLWNGSLNDQIATLTQEQDSAVLVDDNELDFNDQSPETLYDGNGVSISVNDKNVALYPNGYQLEVNGNTIGSIDLPSLGPYTGGVHFMKTTQDNIVGLHWESAGLNVGEFKNYFVNIDSSELVSLEQEAHFVLDPKSIVRFGENGSALQVSLSDSTFCTSDPVVKTEKDCNELYPVSTDGLLLDGIPVVTFDAVDLDHGFHAQGETLVPYTNISWLGVNSELDRAYFTFFGETYSIDAEGQVEESTHPDDLVKMTDELYE